jgi:hypothetical protein
MSETSHSIFLVSNIFERGFDRLQDKILNLYAKLKFIIMATSFKMLHDDNIIAIITLT